MKTYSLLKVTDDVTIAINGCVFMLEYDRDELVHVILVPGQPVPVKLRGEASQAFSAFLGGTVNCPVNVNGVCDIMLGWDDHQRARAFGEPVPFDVRELRDPELVPPLAAAPHITQNVTQGTGPEAPPTVPGRIDWSKVEKRARGEI